MRTNKFRGKRVDNGEWFYGYVYKIENKLGWATCVIVIVYPMVKKEGERYR